MAIIFGVTFMLALYCGANYYIARKIYQWLCLFVTHINIKVYTGIYVFLFLSMFTGFFQLPSGIKYAINWVSSIWMGIFIYLLMLFLLADLVVLLGNTLNIIPTPIPQTIRFVANTFVIISTVCLVGYGMHNANQIKHVSYDIQLSESTLSSNFKIVLISDLHLGAVNSEKNLDKVVREINAMEPDIICITGDIFNDDFNSIQNPERAIDLFRSLNTSYGVYACLGNHDGGKTLDQMMNFLNKSNIKLLNDEYEIIDERLLLVGRLDSSPIGGFGTLKRQDITDAISFVDSNMPVIVMDHNPEHIEEYGREVDLILSGHTHRGQIFPGSLFTNAIFIVDYGYYQKDSNSPQVIVTSGVGTWGMPMRIGSNSEIVSITLR